MLNQIEDCARRVLSSRIPKTAPIEALLADDQFCRLMMQHRMEQGLRIPDQNPDIAPSLRLAWLQALSGDGDLAQARAICDQRESLMEKIRKFRDLEPSEIRDMLIDSIASLLDARSTNSFWAGQHLLYGEDRIAESTIPMHEKETGVETAVSVVMGLMRRPPDALITISDRNPETEAVGFIRIGREPAHFSFPETASPKTGTNAAILHYEIDHPGGEMLFFTSPGIDNPVGDFMMRLEDRNPLYINEMNQLMAVNSYYLQEMGAFCVPCGDTMITMLLRDGVLTAAERPELSGEADRILAELGRRGVAGDERARIGEFLRRAEVQDDYDWDLVERLAAQHPDLLGYQGMPIERSSFFGMARADMEELALRLCTGDAGAAEAAMADMLSACESVPLEEGRHHLYVPNLASRSRLDQALPAFNRLSGRADRDMIFVLADHPLDFGDDPHLVASMRKLRDHDLDGDLRMQ